MNIVLIGYRGTGKSTVGKVLAQRLMLELVSTDDEIVRRAHLSIPDIVSRDGWEHFRDLESQVCRDLAGKDQLVIDTGGGAILRPQNVQVLRDNGQVIWLTASVLTIVSRIETGTNRPSLTGTKSFTQEVEEVLLAREPRYAAAAHHIISTEEQTVEEVVQAVLRAVGNRSNG
jgi:shikimate kinase